MSFPKKWFQWESELSTAGSSQRENESKAAAHFDLKVKRKILCHWRSCAAPKETKKKLNGGFSVLHYLNNQELIHSRDYISLTGFFFAHCHCFAFLSAMAQCFRHLRLLRMFWSKWTAALHLRQWDENSSGSLTEQHRDADPKPCILIRNQTLFSNQWQHSKLVCERFSESTELLNSSTLCQICFCAMKSFKETELQGNITISTYW